MSGTVFLRLYKEPLFDKKEAARYLGLGCRGEIPRDVEELIDSAFSECRSSLSYKVCFSDFPLKFSDGEIDLGFARVKSVDLAKNLRGCEKIILFASTVGIAMDRFISKYAKISPSRSLAFQAIGAERVEALCDTFNAEIKQECAENGFFTCPRFSPGYGDLSIELQRDIMRTLDCERKIGVSVGESLLMSPSKSVTAIIGVGKNI